MSHVRFSLNTSATMHCRARMTVVRIHALGQGTVPSSFHCIPYCRAVGHHMFSGQGSHGGCQAVGYRRFVRPQLPPVSLGIPWGLGTVQAGTNPYLPPLASRALRVRCEYRSIILITVPLVFSIHGVRRPYRVSSAELDIILIVR